MEYLIVDTNVPLKASNTRAEDEVDRKCSQECLKFLDLLMNSNNVVVLDSEREILREYQRRIKTDGENSVASEFLMWIYRNLLSGNVVQHKITKIGENEYEEFPSSPALMMFDRSDRKFVALSKAHPLHPNIYNGSDTDWWIFKDALEEEGVHVVFLCEDYMRAKCKGT